MRPNFPILQRPPLEYLLSKFPAINAYLEKSLVRLSYQIDEFLLDLSLSLESILLVLRME